MIISFSVFKDKIESGEKKQTIRRYTEKRYKQFCNAKKYQLYWGNPRNRGTLIKEVEPSYKPQIIKYLRKDHFAGIKQFKHKIIYIVDIETGIIVNPFVLAKEDGFENDIEMHDWFFNHYGVTMYDETFMVLRWK